MLAKVINVLLNQSKTSKAGNAYVAHELIVSGEKGDRTIVVMPRDPNIDTLLASLQKLKEGDEVKLIFGRQDGQFKKLSQIEPAPAGSLAAALANPFKPNGGKRDVEGMIKGNAVSNGVQVAIARHGKNVNLSHMIEAAKEVLQVHKALEAESSRVVISPLTEELAAKQQAEDGGSF